MAKRTVVQFETNMNIWPLVEAWAQERDFRPRKRDATSCVYQQGNGLMVAQKMVQARQDGTRVELMGWVPVNILNRICTLFIMPAELDLGTGLMGAIPRSTARRDFNVLLQRLGQPPVYAK